MCEKAVSPGVCLVYMPEESPFLFWLQRTVEKWQLRASRFKNGLEASFVNVCPGRRYGINVKSCWGRFWFCAPSTWTQASESVGGWACHSMWLPGPVHGVSEEGENFLCQVAILLENDPQKALTRAVGHRNKGTRKSDKIKVFCPEWKTLW